MKVDGWERLRRRNRSLKLIFVSLCGVATACLVFVVAHRHAGRTAPSFPLLPRPPSVVLENVPETLELSPLGPPISSFANIPKPYISLPNLNSDALTVLVLNDLNGIWTDGEWQLVIDAQKLRGHFGNGLKTSFQKIIVRDRVGLMITLDIGAQRFVLLRRSGGVAVGSASLKAPLELHKLR